MRRISTILVLFVMLITATSSVAAAQGFDTDGEATTPQQEFVPDQLLVRFQPATTARRVDQILANHGASHIRHLAALDVHTLRLPPGLSVEQAVEVFSRLPEVVFAEPNYILRVLAQPATEVTDQWDLIKIQAPEAWDHLGENPPSVLLAIVDTGIDRTHPDLAANIWQNPGEVADDNLDNDGNGYVDDTWGWDFRNGDNDPVDDHFHGTAVSSVAAAVRGNGGIAGVCPGCKLVAVKVMGADGSGALDTVADGIIYAADIGARVINLSLGGIIGSQTLQSAVDYAWGRGALVVAAAGNDGADARLWPAAYANAMAIASTDEQDYRSSFSNFGEGYISVAAPGEAIITADLSEDEYGTYSGTSLSAPHVSGLGGLLFSQNPARTNADVRTIIETTSNDLGPVGTDPYFGTGRINAYRALTGDTSPTDPPVDLFSDDLSASGYAHARKLIRDANGTLHQIWHGKDGEQYRVLYATSSDDGANWSPPQVVFGSSAETFHPALATDGDWLYVAFPTKHDSTSYRIFFTKRLLSGGDWSPPVALMGGAYHAVRPDLYFDPAYTKLHLVASSFDDAPYVYYTSSSDGGGNWSAVAQVNAGYWTRYASVHAHADNIYLAGRTVELYLYLGLIPVPRYRTFAIHSLDNGDTWSDPVELALQDGLIGGEYGVSLAGIGDRLYLSYEHNGGIYFRRSEGDGNWSVAENIGGGGWPSLTQQDDGQAWILWESDGSLSLRHYTGSDWDPAETLTAGYYPNLKLGTNGGFVEWAATQKNGAPFRLTYGSRAIDASNNLPVANDDSAATDEDTPVTINILANDTDPDGDPLTVTNLSQPANGTATLNPDNTVTYAPNPDFNGLDSFTYMANDGAVNSNLATVNVTVNPVNDPPVASDDNATTDEDTLVTVDVLTNDADPDGDPLTVTNLSQPANGSVTPNADNTVTYVPNSGFSGPDSFTYTANDGTVDGNVATVSVTVNPVNDPPVANDDSATTDEDTLVTVDVLANDADPDGDPLTVTNLSQPANGAATLNPDNTVSYTPNPDFNGIDSFTYTANDGTGDGNVATVNVTINPVNDTPVASDDSAATDEDTPVTIDVLANDADLDGDPLMVTNLSQPANGTATLNPDNTVTYTPNPDFNGLDSFTYTANDGAMDSNIVTVSVTVNSINNAPTANNDNATTTEDTSVTIDVLANDSDPDSDSLSVSAISPAANGNVSTDGATVIYTPNAGFIGNDSFTYRATDGLADSNDATVIITVNPGYVHVGDLDSEAVILKKSHWQVVVTVVAHDTNHNPVAGAMVSGAWSGGYSEAASCTTDSNGQCSLTSGSIQKRYDSVTFTVNDVTHTAFTYNAAANHDLNGDSDGTSIVTLRP